MGTQNLNIMNFLTDNKRLLNKERFTPLSEQRSILRKYWNGLTTDRKLDWEKFVEDAEHFNNVFKDCYPNQGNATFELIVKTLTL